jgi:hypothetical protein
MGDDDEEGGTAAAALLPPLMQLGLLPPLLLLQPTRMIDSRVPAGGRFGAITHESDAYVHVCNREIQSDTVSLS